MLIRFVSANVRGLLRINLLLNLSAFFFFLTAGAANAASNLAAAYGMSEGSGATTADASGNGNTGTLSGQSWTTSGKYGNALLFSSNGAVDLGNSTSLQITGSMTIEAWINPSAFPGNDSGVVSKRGPTGDLGYQLDTTVDTGPRTIGFKLADPSGSSMIRYGSTTLVTGSWQHVAGVYDAATQTMHVYLNGVLDDGSSVGTVASSQRNSSLDVFIGKRAGATGMEFSGTIDEVRIYSRALSQSEIQADMNTTINSSDATPPTAPSNLTATAVSSSQVNLSWTASTDNVGVAGYWIERCQGAGCSNFARVNSSLVTGTSYSNTGLTAATSYSYRVQAADSAGNISAYSNSVFILATSAGYTISSIPFGYTSYSVEGLFPISPISLPFSFSFFNASYSSLSIGINGFISFQNFSPFVCCDMQLLPTAGIPDAVIAAYWGYFGFIFSGGSIQYGTVGAAPNRIFVIEYINVLDFLSGNLVSFQIKLFEGSNAIEIHCASCPSGGAAHTQGIENETGAIAAFVPGRNLSNFSLTNDAIRFADTIAPAAPSSAVAVPINSGQINLSWTASTDNLRVGGYYVERCQGTGCSNFTRVSNSLVTTNSYSDTGLSPSTSYNYRVQSADTSGNLGGYSNATSVVTKVAEYTTSTIPFGYTSYAVEGSFVPVMQASSPIPLSFSFSFFNDSYTNFSIGSDGFIVFNNLPIPPFGCCFAQPLPSTGMPDGVIAAYWGQIASYSALTGFIQYGTAGTAPNRIFVVEFINVPYIRPDIFFDMVNFQVKLFEGSNAVEIHCASCPSGGGARSQGIENGTGSVAFFLPGRNFSDFSLTNDAVRFADTTSPTAPSNLTATVVSSGQIDLSWTAATDNNGVTGYQVERCKGASCTTFTQIAVLTGRSYSDTGLEARTAYRYRVRAVDVGGNLGAYSNIVSVSTSPSEYTISSVSFGYSSYAMENMVQPGLMEVYSPIPLPFSFSFFNTSYSNFSIGTHGFISFLQNLPNFGCCGVQALPSTGVPDAVIAPYWWPYSHSGGGIIQYGTAGAAPNRIFIIEYNNVFDPSSGNTVTFQVKLFEGSNAIEIHCASCLSGGAPHTQGIENQTGATAVFVPGRNFASFSLTNDAIRFTPVAAGAPIAPSSLSAVDHPADQGKVIDLTWTPSTNAGITQQRIYRSTPSSPYVLVATINNNTTNSYSDNNNLANGVTYYYVVRAFNGTLESGNSNESSTAPIDNLAPNALTSVTAADHPADQGGAIDLSWTVSTSTDVTEQRIYRATSSNGTYLVIKTFLGNSTLR